MERIIKQVVGIDVGSKELVVCIGRIDQNLRKEIYTYRSFRNTPIGGT
jgi:transposase